MRPGTYVELDFMHQPYLWYSGLPCLHKQGARGKVIAWPHGVRTNIPDFLQDHLVPVVWDDGLGLEHTTSSPESPLFSLIPKQILKASPVALKDLVSETAP